MIDLPFVENVNTWPSSPIEYQCIYYIPYHSYYVYLNNTWVEAISEFIAFPDGIPYIYILQYKLTSNPDVLVTETYNDETSLFNGIIAIKTNATEIYEFRGFSTAPNYNVIFTTAKFWDSEDSFALIQILTNVNNIYTYTPIAQIFPKIIFNDDYICDTNLIYNDNQINKVYYNGALVFAKTKPTKYYYIKYKLSSNADWNTYEYTTFNAFQNALTNYKNQNNWYDLQVGTIYKEE